MHFNELLEMVGINPTDTPTLVLRHQPREKELRRVFAWIAQEKPELFNAYQNLQGDRVSKSMRKARYIASFIAMRADNAFFVGLYEAKGYAPKSKDELLRLPDVHNLVELGMGSEWPDEIYWHDLEPTELLAPFRFSLTIRWPGLARSWVRWADRNVFEVLPSPVAEEIRTGMPNWDNLDLSWGELKNLPPSWRVRLSEWRGIYLIFDTATSQGYVGSAFGQENLMGRWLDYGKSGHGGNKLLRGRDPKNFRFTILQRVSPDMGSEEVQELEASWKRRLHAREYGLNKN